MAKAGPQEGFLVVLEQLPNTQKFDKEARETLLDVFRDAADYWAEKKVPFRVFLLLRSNLRRPRLQAGPVPARCPAHCNNRNADRLAVQCAPMKNIVILISGRGSNMEAVVRAAQPSSGRRGSRRSSATGRRRRAWLCCRNTASRPPSCQ
jgi:hypothetical protein